MPRINDNKLTARPYHALIISLRLLALLLSWSFATFLRPLCCVTFLLAFSLATFLFVYRFATFLRACCLTAFLLAFCFATFLRACYLAAFLRTFCSYIVGYRNDYTGSVCFDGRSTRELRVSDWVRLRQRHLSCLFQELRLFPELTALENVEIKNKLTGHKTRREIEEWFDMLGIGDKLHAKAGLMSFGQQQRVALIRSLVQPFDFLLADEPISHLDDTNSRIMGDIMMAEARRQGAGVIVTSIGKHMNMSYDKTYRL